MVRPRRGRLRADRRSVAEVRPGGLPGRAPLPDDGHRHRLEPRASRVSRVDIDRDGPTYTIDTLRDLRRAAPGRRAVLHHRRRRAGRHLHLARRGRAVRAGQLRGLHPARLRPWTPTTLDGSPPTGSPSSRSRPWRSRRPTAASASSAGSRLVPRAGRRRPVHRQARPLPRSRQTPHDRHRPRPRARPRRRPRGRRTSSPSRSSPSTSPSSSRSPTRSCSPRPPTTAR